MENNRNQVSSTPALGRIESFLYTLVVVACLLTMPVIYYQWQGVNSGLLMVADWCIWTIFVVEYGVLLILAPDRKRYIAGSWLNAGIIALSFPQLPALMGFVRLVRLTRILRLFLVATKGLRTMKVVVSQRSFVYVLSVTALLVVVAAQLLHMLEPMPGGFADGLWWAVVTTTCGLWRCHSKDSSRPFCRGHADAGGNGSNRHCGGFGVGLLRWSRTN